jgi:hypothetical protein
MPMANSASRHHLVSPSAVRNLLVIVETPQSLATLTPRSRTTRAVSIKTLE